MPILFILSMNEFNDLNSCEFKFEKALSVAEHFEYICNSANVIIIV